MGGDGRSRDRFALTLRPAMPADTDLLRGFCAERHGPQLSSLGWRPDQITALVSQQSAAQEAGYAAAFPEADHSIVLVEGDPVGRILVDRRADRHLLVDMVIVSRWRRLGIGTAVLDGVVDRARRAGVPVTLTVDARDSSLVAWYARRGFAVASRGELHLAMVLAPAPRQT